MSTLEGKIVLLIGGSSGIGFAVAKASLLSFASHVVIASSSPQKVKDAVTRLEETISQKSLPGRATGYVVDAHDSAAIRALVTKVGEIDHLVWTSGEPLKIGFPNIDLDTVRNAFDVRFWGALVAAQSAKFKPGGSVTMTVGTVVVKPRPTWTVAAGVSGAVDAVARGLAVDLAPIRVNVISPGIVKTELWDTIPPAQKEKIWSQAEATLLVKHLCEPEEIAEAYLFVMKCGFITGQRLEVDGGFKYV
ncbi:NAD-binding protein [Rickenella mellea]|uniref:NAD-binding protein n=1 Tax=Rickenella mellea TaxID=50990 RepID=A0A4Y7PKI0_9AGAM|nr:NAD-binding protein [Rickenella mellea]